MHNIGPWNCLVSLSIIIITITSIIITVIIVIIIIIITTSSSTTTTIVMASLDPFPLAGYIAGLAPLTQNKDFHTIFMENSKMVLKMIEMKFIFNELLCP